MKLSVIMPVVDVPVGSGRPGFWLKNSIQSVLDGGHDDFELLIGCDGHIPAIEEAVASFRDPRLVYIAFPLTKTWGNYQRHHLMKTYATGDYFTFMDHDDSYKPGALKDINEECETFPGRAFLFRVTLRCNVDVWTDRNILRERNVAGQGVVAPRGSGYPLWGASSDRREDLKFVRATHDYAAHTGAPALWIETNIATIRPWAPPEKVHWVDLLWCDNERQALVST